MSSKPTVDVLDFKSRDVDLVRALICSILTHSIDDYINMNLHVITKQTSDPYLCHLLPWAFA